MDAVSDPPVKATSSLRRRTFAAGCLSTFFAIAYFFRPDALQAVHWWPMPLWSPVALLPWVGLHPKRLVKPIAASLGLWLIVSALQGEVPATMPMPKDSPTARVVTLNCAGGSEQAAEEAFQVGADLVLLQEVASRDAFVAKAKARGYNQVAWSFDDAIFSQSPLTDILAERDFVAATWHFGGKKVRVVSLRLHPPTFRLDFWNPECWRAYAEDTRQRRDRFGEIAKQAALGEVWIVGGDFNATNPRIVQGPVPEAEEAMRTAGTTWIGTGTNDYPLAPVDQLWARLGWTQAEVRRTRYSDHRMVVAETTPFY